MTTNPAKTPWKWLHVGQQSIICGAMWTIYRYTAVSVGVEDPFSTFIAAHFLFRAFEYSTVSCLLQLSSSLRIRTARPSSYHEAKQAAAEYHGAKQALFKAFQKAGLGAWVKKPIEQDQFSVATWVGAAPAIASNFSLRGCKINFPLEWGVERMWGIMDFTFLLYFTASCPLQQAWDNRSVELVLQLYI